MTLYLSGARDGIDKVPCRMRLNISGAVFVSARASTSHDDNLSMNRRLNDGCNVSGFCLFMLLQPGQGSLML